MLRVVEREGETWVLVGVGEAARAFRPGELGLTPALERFLRYPAGLTVAEWLAEGRQRFSPLWTDALLLQWFEGGAAQGAPEIVPYSFLPFPPGAGALNYAQSAFEGCKAFVLREGGELVLRFHRGADAARRMALSARRLAMDVPAESLGALFEEWIPELLRANGGTLASVAFDPGDPDCHRFYEGGDPGRGRLNAPPPAAYVRPVLCGWGPVLGVKPSGQYLFYAHVTPVGPYRGAMTVALSGRQRRAVLAGTGAAKAAGNYAGTLNLYRDRDEADRVPGAVHYDDFLFLDDRGCLEELSGANLFLAQEQQGAPPLLRTPRYVERANGPEPTAADRDAELGDNTFLNGMTRRTVLQLAEWLGFEVRQDDGITVEDLVRDPGGTALFATGTAASVAPITRVGALDAGGWNRLGRAPGPPIAFRSWDNPWDPATGGDPDPLMDRIRWVRHALLACQYGLPAEIGRLAGARGAHPDIVARVTELSRRLTSEVRMPFPR